MAEKLLPERHLDKQYPKHDPSETAEDRKQGGMDYGFQGGNIEVTDEGRRLSDILSGILHGLNDDSPPSAASTSMSPSAHSAAEVAHRSAEAPFLSAPEHFARYLMGRVMAGAISVPDLEKALCEALEDTRVNDGNAGVSLDSLPDGGDGRQSKADRRSVLARCAMAFFREYVTASAGFQGGRSPVNALRRPSQGNVSPETSGIAGEAGMSGLPPGKTDNPSGSVTGYPSVASGQPVGHHTDSVWAGRFNVLESKMATSPPPTMPLLLPPLAALPSRLLNLARDTADYALMRDLRVVLQQATLAPVGLGR